MGSNLSLLRTLLRRFSSLNIETVDEELTIDEGLTVDDGLMSAVLSRIFHYLTVDDRKNVRLVCQRWNLCCNCPSILKTEKLVFYHRYPLTMSENPNFHKNKCDYDEKNTIENINLTFPGYEFRWNDTTQEEETFPRDYFTRNKRDTVEFHGLSLDKLSSDVWCRLGMACTQSLTLIKCKASKEVIKKIFCYFEDLRSFKCYECEGLFDPQKMNETILGNAGCGRERGSNWPYPYAKRRELIDFQLLNRRPRPDAPENTPRSPEELLQNIFEVYPCIRNFEIFLKCSNFNGSLRNTFDPALIKEISLNIPCSGLWLQQFSNVSELKLQKLDFTIGNLTVPVEIFAQFLQNQTELKTLNIRLLEIEKEKTKTVLFTILSMCPELINFSLKCYTSLKMDEFYRALQTVSGSKLESLVLHIYRCYDADDEIFKDNLSVSLPPLMNKRLRTLRLTFVNARNGLLADYCVPILKHFCNLQDLEIVANSDEVLQTIFQFQIHLKTLILTITDNCTAFGLTGCRSGSSIASDTSYSISQLQELTHLKLIGFPHDAEVLEKTLKQFNFPHLKYFHLSNTQIEKMNLRYLPELIPSAEILIFDDIKFQNDDDWMYFCQHLQKLKVVSYPWRHSKFIQDMFTCRPDLEYALDNLRQLVYSYNLLSKSAQVCSFDRIHILDHYWPAGCHNCWDF